PLAEGAYSGSFTITSNDPLHITTTVTTTANILPALPEGLVIIGDGALTNQGLPFEPWYKHSYSQSIYTAGEIGLSDQRVEKISWHYNGNSAWGPDVFKVYMGLTSETTFANNTSWVSNDDMMEVYDGTITVPSTDGLVEIILDIPFNYSASQNLVVGVFHTADPYHTSSDEFYCTQTTGTRSILYYGDSIIPDPASPPTANYMRSAYPNVHLQFGPVPDAPDLTVYPHNTTYEMVPVNGSSMEKTFTMRSIGLQDITIPSAPTFGGTNADQFSITTDNNTYPIVLPLGELATIGVTFSPTSEGTKSATLIVTGGGDRRETYTVNLNGYAYADDGNDQPTGATVLTLPVEGDTYAIMPIGDVDWYKIPAMGIGDTLMAHTTMAGGSNINTKLWLYGPATDPADIAGTAFVTSGTNITHVLPASGNYYLRVAQTNVNPSRSNPHTRKNFNGETERDLRDDTGLYNLFVSANYNYDYNAPVNFEASNQSGFVELTWEEPDYERYLIGYNVYRDGSVITPTMIPIGTNTYNDAEVVVGVEYTYYAVGMYEDPNGFSLPSNSITLTYFNSGEPLWGDDFEDHRDFILDMPNWIQYDVDGGDTYGISNVEFENAGAPMSYIVFNPAATTPPITDMIPQSGNKFIASFASSEGENNDWIITPRVVIGSTTVVSFYARSYTSDYGLEKFKVKMSLGGDQVENFTYTLHQGQTHLEAPTEWTPFHFNVSQLAGNTARFAIQCISTDAFILMIDNFRIDSTDDGSDNDDVVIVPQVNALSQNYPNPFNPETSISFSMQDAGKVSLDIYNIKGQKVKTLLNDHREAGTHNIVWNGTDDNNKNVSSGIYFYRMKNGKFSSTKKMILMK
ncbi:MAG: choice-of-anchor J domain-containing protein, partial [Candidatus Cloacimonadales bacterium]